MEIVVTLFLWRETSMDVGAVYLGVVQSELGQPRGPVTQKRFGAGALNALGVSGLVWVAP